MSIIYDVQRRLLAQPAPDVLADDLPDDAQRHDDQPVYRPDRVDADQLQRRQQHR